METVRVNGLTLCHKNSQGMVMATIPDVCKTPSPGGPVPIPYPNIAFARDLAKGTTTVKSNGGAMCGVLGSEFSISTGDEPGSVGGVASSVFKKEATFISFSMNVRLQGKFATRLTDKMLMNHMNTVSMGGYFTGPVVGASLASLDTLCAIACECLAKGQKQDCVEVAVRALPHTPTDGMYPEVSFDRAGTMQRLPDGSPATVYFQPGSRLDIVTVAGGQPVEFIEMKFPGDRWRRGQRSKYEAIARRHGKQIQPITVPADCNNCEGERQPEEEPSTVSSWLPWAIVAGVAIGAAACIYFTAGACAPVAGEALGGAIARTLGGAALGAAVGAGS